MHRLKEVNKFPTLVKHEPFLSFYSDACMYVCNRDVSVSASVCVCVCMFVRVKEREKALYMRKREKSVCVCVFALFFLNALIWPCKYIKKCALK